MITYLGKTIYCPDCLSDDLAASMRSGEDIPYYQKEVAVTCNNCNCLILLNADGKITMLLEGNTMLSSEEVLKLLGD